MNIAVDQVLNVLLLRNLLSFIRLTFAIDHLIVDKNVKGHVQVVDD